MVGFVEYAFKLNAIWRKSDLYLLYRIEDLITPRYWSYSMLIIYIDQSNLDFYAFEGISEALTLWPFDLSRLHARETQKT